MARAQCALVPVRTFSPNYGASTANSSRAKPWTFGRRHTSRLPDDREIRPAALPVAALHLLARRRRYARRRHVHAPARQIFLEMRKARAIPTSNLFGPRYSSRRSPPTRPPSRRLFARDVRGWFDFWTGAATPGGQTIDAPAPYDALPYTSVRARSCPSALSCSTPRKNPPTDHAPRVRGANGAFTSMRTTVPAMAMSAASLPHPTPLGRRPAHARHGRREGAFPACSPNAPSRSPRHPRPARRFFVHPESRPHDPYRGEPVETRLP